MEDNIKILIVEDEVLIADYIKEILEENGFSDICLSHNVKDAQEKMEIFLPDIILMDINIEGSFEGISLSQNKNEYASIIFITGQSDSGTIKNALASSPETYLTKPIRKIELLTAVKIAALKKQQNHIVIKDGYKKIKLNFADIIYIQSDKNYIDIYLIDRKITVRKTLQEFCKELPAYFKQIHRSIIINTHCLEKTESDEVIVNGEKLPFTRSFRQNLS